MVSIDTRMKLLLFFIINIMVFGLKDLILGSISFGSICILTFLMGQRKKTYKYIIIYVVIILISRAVLFLPPALRSIGSIFSLLIRVMVPIVLFASAFITTTKVSELIAAMYSLKIPRSITITFAMTLRFFPTLKEEFSSIIDAMKLRGITFTIKNIFTRPLLIIEAIFVPVILRSATIAEELSASSVTRGIDNPEKRSSFVQLKIHPHDIIIACSFIILFCVLFYFKKRIYGRI